MQRRMGLRKERRHDSMATKVLTFRPGVHAPTFLRSKSPDAQRWTFGGELDHTALAIERVVGE